MVCYIILAVRFSAAYGTVGWHLVLALPWPGLFTAVIDVFVHGP